MRNNEVIDIDVHFNFTSDTPHYWDNYWNNNNGLGAGSKDPDKRSKTLQRYHQMLWSRLLPNGEYMDLSICAEPNYLSWKDFRFSSDSIIVSFRYERYKEIIDQVKKAIPCYNDFMEDYVRRSYTIGGVIIFPKRQGGINQSRGCNPLIRDRWDLTLECIRLYYNDEQSPLYHILLKDKAFFDLFVDFHGYVNFFCLQDCVTPDYQSVIFWFGNAEFTENPLPRTVSEYLHWIEKELEFVESRNKRINALTYN